MVTGQLINRITEMERRTRAKQREGGNNLLTGDQGWGESRIRENAKKTVQLRKDFTGKLT